MRCSRNRRNRDGLLRQFYSAEEIDAYAAYCADLERCYLMPIAEFSHRTAIQLRLSTARTIKASASTGLRTTNSPLHFVAQGP
ncbi:MAG: group I intron-associated PD-(D/E)XK endonuclease [Gaiellaceae bacterium]